MTISARVHVVNNYADMVDMQFKKNSIKFFYINC